MNIVHPVSLHFLLLIRWYLLVYFSRYLDQETVKGRFRVKLPHVIISIIIQTQDTISLSA